MKMLAHIMQKHKIFYRPILKASLHRRLSSKKTIVLAVSAYENLLLFACLPSGAQEKVTVT